MISRRPSIAESTVHGFQQLAPPISFKLISLSLAWYWSSAVSNTLTKSILNVFPYPITLTVLQFAFVVFWALTISSLCRSGIPSMDRLLPFSHTGIAKPSKQVFLAVAPMAVFQLSGHILSHIATSKIPVSLVHTIKGLAPLVTVLAYRFFYGVHYTPYTYVSLVPLTLGVMLACSFEFRGQLDGILCAMFATVVFVSQNIVSKKLLTNSPSEIEPKKKLDKISLMCYCSGMAFVMTFPIWFYYEGSGLIQEYFATGSLPIQAEGLETPMPMNTLAFLFFMNGTIHFGQNFLAFQILGMVSPVTYSIASLFKRVFVIIVAIIWFGQQLTGVQSWGIALTFLGLYLYDRAGDAAQFSQMMGGPKTPTFSSLGSARNSNDYRPEVSDREDVVNSVHMLHSTHVLQPNGGTNQSILVA
ncbi:triose-phosphate transporter family-domain-containing protein [Lipomyces oligophaga]|uniref:triose-phosphate transporter family-domain-containing protein n=1 Tax=Lipomyces oligophaga TaxID=45792 RepID=UPI0034CD8D9A